MKQLFASLGIALFTTPAFAQLYSASIHVPSAGHQASLRRGAGGIYGGFSVDPGGQIWRAQILGVSGWKDLTPPGQAYSRVLDVFRTYQVGYCASTYTHGASLWRGSAGSFVNLHPQGYLSSAAYAMEGQRVVGYATYSVYDPPRAAVWTSPSPAGLVNVHPAGWRGSIIHDTDGVRHVGVLTGSQSIHAGIWEGTTPYVIDLNPSWANDSFAAAMHDGLQVGFARLGGLEHAVRWSGSSLSAVDLHPPFAQSSSALGVFKRVVVGYYALAHQNDRYAAVLEGPNGFVDLHQYLPAGYVNSSANGIADNGYILGEATLANGSVHGVIWKP